MSLKFWKLKIIIPREIIKIPVNSNVEILILKKSKENITIKMGADPRAIGYIFV